jgi:hypothetical protein
MGAVCTLGPVASPSPPPRSLGAWTWQNTGTTSDYKAYGVSEGFSLDDFTVVNAPAAGDSGPVLVTITGENVGNSVGNPGYNRLRFQVKLGQNAVGGTPVGSVEQDPATGPASVSATVNKLAAENTIIVLDLLGNNLAIFTLAP